MGLGLPTVVDLEEEGGEETEARNNTNFAAALSDSDNIIGDDPTSVLGHASSGCFVQTFKGKVRRALKCPCLVDLVNGPCGGEFTKAFGCFIKSQEPEKGSDCIEPFNKMQCCMIINAGEFSSADISDPPMPQIERGNRLLPQQTYMSFWGSAFTER